MFHYDSIKKPLLGNWNWYGWTVFHFHHNQDGATTAPTIILPLYVFVFVSVFWTKFSSVLYLYCAPLECALWLLLLLHLVTFCPWALPACNFQGGAKGGRVASNRWQTPSPSFIVDVATRLCFERVWVIWTYGPCSPFIFCRNLLSHPTACSEHLGKSVDNISI